MFWYENKSNLFQTQNKLKSVSWQPHIHSWEYFSYPEVKILLIFIELNVSLPISQTRTFLERSAFWKSLHYSKIIRRVRVMSLKHPTSVLSLGVSCPSYEWGQDTTCQKSLGMSWPFYEWGFLNLLESQKSWRLVPQPKKSSDVSWAGLPMSQSPSPTWEYKIIRCFMSFLQVRFPQLS